YDTCARCDYTTYEEIAALGHDLVSHEAKEPTCTEVGWNAYDTCSRCDYTTYEETAALGHELVPHEGKAPTCTEKGFKAYDTCARCDYTSFEELDALGHDLVHHDEKAATCTEKGYKAYDACSRCDYTTFEETPALGHTPGKVQIENEVPATTSAPGSYDKVVYCEVCGHEMTRKTIPVPVIPAITSLYAKELGKYIYVVPGTTAGSLKKLAGEASSVTKNGVAVDAETLLASGMELTKEDGTKLFVIVKGDNDGDGEITASDARNALRIAVRLDEPEEWQLYAGIVTDDSAADTGKLAVSAADARAILRVAVKLDDPSGWIKYVF
ncbi:MAG: hypothetical protein IJS90_01685, partial [Clostridia bacterium]|nr:hypothetical protein [Clostridia bacterium]